MQNDIKISKKEKDFILSKLEIVCECFQNHDFFITLGLEQRVILKALILRRLFKSDLSVVKIMVDDAYFFINCIDTIFKKYPNGFNEDIVKRWFLKKEIKNAE